MVLHLLNEMIEGRNAFFHEQSIVSLRLIVMRLHLDSF